ncbi:MAG TPA: head-tail adaptor protein [Candidatus Paceibacterota bacterium]|nr:head-tail adaptor protein [Candidatus Paceibacterota bacterium]
MRLGRLDRRIEIQQPVLTVNDYGERDKTYTVFHSCWAKVTERYGDEKDLSEVDYPVLRVSFFIRHKAGVLQQFRVLHEGFLYEILEVKEVTYSRNRYLELITERRGNQSGDATGAPVASDATYENSDGSFSQAIPSGDTYVAPDITITDVDGNTRDVPANTDVTCQWTELSVQNTENVEKQTVSSYPSGGAIELDDVKVTDADGYDTDFPMPSQIGISGRPITSVFYSSVADLLAITVESCPVVFPIDIVNSLGSTLDTISADPSGSFQIGTVNVVDADGTEAVQRPSTEIEVLDSNGLVSATVTQSTLGLKIQVPEAASPSGIAYAMVNAPLSTESLNTNDCFDLFQKGVYDYVAPSYPESFACIDRLATQADVRATPATGTNNTDPVAATMLKHNNAFGNKFRYTDDQGNASDASVGSNIWAHVDWINHSFTGATDGYVIDHFLNIGILIENHKPSGNSSLSDQSVADFIGDFDDATSIKGYTGWRILDVNNAIQGAHGAKCENGQVWADNFFIADRVDNRCGMMTGDVIDTNDYAILYDSGSDELVVDVGFLTGFQQGITHLYPIRTHYT